MMPAAATRVQAALEAHGLTSRVIVLEHSARTAAEAAHACGVEVGQIVKSLVFVAGEEPVLVLTSGANQVDERRLEALTGGRVARADAARVRAATGFSIGGVPPLAHTTALPVFIDRDLIAFDRLVAAGGTPETVFAITPTELVAVTRGRVVDVKRRGAGQEDGARCG
jgi:prolyl-tRNA editing enzyme YbaK/EbsC (Cys-tRNA(Pro) deacylase)